MGNLSLVTGANGHLGNNLTRALLAQGHRVRAGVRDLDNTQPFAGLDCELVYAALEDKAAMLEALEGVEVLYQVAAVFKHWSLDPEAEIVRANVEGTRIVLETAAQAGVKRVVYVSSVAAVGHNGQPLNEDSWNQDLSNPYYRSKILAEQQAWQVAQAQPEP
ncbi:NAD-dependent epimerase/dehydratase family protein [Pseudomonas lalucatii]|uniref:NAD-dependent epimerase/dehydratase family protein n=1 Tax=Pseudomonas lalucatii TaxID=1424203 RepID=A0ABS5Q1N2_9PSED|nr:NAD-dependent epimerase/dehydratase family protein [Pseudomonas lalucatii]MBS7725765.1 NAD-dependent epimerase/dehydratase family protein [Pseudomonas lalucatii]QVM88620.1 NAD-dependent epimerase/dehydratase family protein [Pseudomonas lalucatii]